MGLCELNETRLASSGPPPRRLGRGRLRRRARRPPGGGGRDRDPAQHPLPARQPGAGGRQARAGREAAGAELRGGRRADRAGRGRDRVLMPGHTFLYSPAVNKIRDLIQEDVLGELYFVTSSRMNLGQYQPDGVVLDLAPHDLSILMMAWQAAGRGLGERPQRVPRGGPRDRLPDAELRGRRPGQRPALLAGAAQGAPDGGRLQADGPVRGHRLDEPVRIYDRGFDFDCAARQLRRVQDDLPDRRHAGPEPPAVEPLWLELATSRPRSATAPRRSPTAASGSRSCSAWRRSSSRCTPRGNPFRFPRSTMS